MPEVIIPPRIMGTSVGQSTPVVRIIRDHDQLDALRADWDRLWAQMSQRDIFQSFDWARAWVEAYDFGHSLFTAVVSDEDVVIGIVPLVLERRELRFVGYSAADYNGIVCEPGRVYDVLRAAFQYIMEHSRYWTRMLLENVPEDSLIVSALEGLPGSVRTLIDVFPDVACPAVLLEQQPNALHEIVSREKVRKACRYFERLGSVSFRYLTRPELDEHLPVFFRQHIRRCAFAGRTSPYSTRSGVRFCEMLTRYLNPDGELRLSVLEVNGRPAAYHLGFCVDGRYLYYRPSFDIDLWHHSPGQVLLFQLFRGLAGTSGLREFNFGTGPEAYKYRFSNVVRHNRTIHMYAPSLKGRLLRTRETFARRVKAAFLAYPAVRNTAETAVRAGSGMLLRIQRQGLWRSVASLSSFPAKRLFVYVWPDTDSIGPSAGGAWQPCTLGDLADFSHETSDFLNSDVLKDASERLKRGERAYLYYPDDSVSPGCAAWVSEQPPIFPCDAEQASRPKIVITQFRTGRTSAKTTAEALRKLALEISTGHHRVWLLYAHGAGFTPTFIRRSGFRLAGECTTPKSEGLPDFA